jgi:hypothetical protein
VTGLEFLSATIGQLIWPVFILVFVLVLREPIKTLAASPRLSKLKAGPSGVEVEFREELGEVQKELAESAKPKGTEHNVGVDKSGLDDFLAEMARLAAVSPRSVVMEAHARLEALLRDAVGPHTRDGGSPRGLGMRALIREAVRQKWLSQEEASALEELAYLRNRVAHEPDTAITTDTALWYANLSAEVATAIHHASGRTTADGPYLPGA